MVATKETVELRLISQTANTGDAKSCHESHLLPCHQATPNRVQPPTTCCELCCTCDVDQLEQFLRSCCGMSCIAGREKTKSLVMPPVEVPVPSVLPDPAENPLPPGLMSFMETSKLGSDSTNGAPEEKEKKTGLPNALAHVKAYQRQQFYKTRLCPHFFATGLCRKNSGCTYAHGESELRPSVNLSKTKLCENYFLGVCKDSSCTFAHGMEELKVTPSFYKTQICKFWRSGECAQGYLCRHAHGESDRIFNTATSSQSSALTFSDWSEPSLSLDLHLSSSSSFEDPLDLELPVLLNRLMSP